MNKSEFLRIIHNSLKTYPPKVSDDIMAKYEKEFENGYSNGKTEEEIINDLGNPYDIAKGYSSNYNYNDFADNTNVNNNTDNINSNFKPNFTEFNFSNYPIKMILIILALIIAIPVLLGVLSICLGTFISFLGIIITLFTITISTIVSLATGNTYLNIFNIDILSIPTSSQVLLLIGNISTIILLSILFYIFMKCITFVFKKAWSYIKEVM